jgi:hypothetical protein
MVGCLVAALLPAASFAQPGRRDGPGRQQEQQHGGQYYYNGRWVDQDEWQRHGSERERWARDYQRRQGHHDDTNTVLAGILGFALGAAIVGSQQQAEHARTADQSWDAYCAKKYRSYDRHSRTYLGKDGLRHYCQ